MHITQRLQFIKLTVLIGMLLSVLLSIHLWAGQRWFPKSPVIEGFNGIAAPYDYVNIAVLAALVFLCLFTRSKKPVWALLFFCLYLCFEDQSRLQPWFFNYLFILCILLFYRQRPDEPDNFVSVFICLQILVALIYIFSGIQKLNSFFVEDSFNWIISPLEGILSSSQMALFKGLGKFVPYIELLTGLGLLIKPFRFIALPMVIIMHVFILLMIGPMGKSFNHVVWPWNLAMILLCLLLYGKVKQDHTFDRSVIFKSAGFYLVIVVMLILPLFSLINKYDSYLSSSLYSGNTHGGTFILTDKAYRKLPYYSRLFVATSPDHNVLYIKRWAMTELNSPCLPEYRVFKRAQDYVIMLTDSKAEDVKLEFTEREKILGF